MGNCASVLDSNAVNKSAFINEEATEDAKAVFCVLNGPSGTNMTPANPSLKLLLTSVGLMRTSSRDVLNAYKDLRKKTPGKGVLVLLDAKLKTLSWAEHGAMNPKKHNNDVNVGYVREPDQPGGKPKLDAKGNLIPKPQSELKKMGIGYHSAQWGFYTYGNYTNCDLNVVAKGAPGEQVPVFLSYMVYHNTTDYSTPEHLRGKPEHHIMMAEGFFKDGQLTLMRSDGSGPMQPEDYEVPSNYSPAGCNCFKQVNDSKFRSVTESVHTIYSSGGVTWLAVNNLQPYFVDDGKVTGHVNVYGKSVLDATRSGQVIYIGQSAGTVSLSHDIGPLTTDLTDFELEGADDKVNALKLDFELGHKMLRPGLGDYLGIPYGLIFRPHLTFDPQKMAYQGRVTTLATLKRQLSSGAGIQSDHDVYCVVMADYDYAKGQGDVLEVSGGKVKYHVGYSDSSDAITEEGKKILIEAGHSVPADGLIRRQPAGNDPNGRAFYWTPKDGTIYAAGPNAKPRPWRIYASSNGPMKAMSPCYPA